MMDFDGVEYRGVVRDIDIDSSTQERLYHVVYEDGDQEHLTARQVNSARRGRQSLPGQLGGYVCQKPLALGPIFSTPTPSRQQSFAGHRLHDQSPLHGPRFSNTVPYSPQFRSEARCTYNATAALSPGSPSDAQGQQHWQINSSALVPCQGSPVFHQQNTNGNNSQGIRTGGILFALILAFVAGYRISTAPTSFYGSVVPWKTASKRSEHASPVYAEPKVEERVLESVDPLMELRQQLAASVLESPFANAAFQRASASVDSFVDPGQKVSRNPASELSTRAEGVTVDAASDTKYDTKPVPIVEETITTQPLHRVRPDVVTWVAGDVHPQRVEPMKTYTVIQQQSSTAPDKGWLAETEKHTAGPKLGPRKVPVLEREEWSTAEKREEWILEKLPILVLTVLILIFRTEISRALQWAILGPPVSSAPSFVGSPVAPPPPEAGSLYCSHPASANAHLSSAASFSPPSLTTAAFHGHLSPDASVNAHVSPVASLGLVKMDPAVKSLKREPVVKREPVASDVPSTMPQTSWARNVLRSQSQEAKAASTRHREVEGLLKLGGERKDYGNLDPLGEVNGRRGERFRHIGALQEIQKMGYGQGEQEDMMKNLLNKHARSIKNPRDHVALAQRAMNEYWDNCQR